MKKMKIILFFVINILPVIILGGYLYMHMGGADDINEVVKSSPFKEFVYIDHKTIMLLKDTNEDIPPIYKKLLIFINGIYIGEHNSIGIKVPLGFLIKYIPINKFEYYNGVLIKNLNKSDLGNANVNNLILDIPPNYKDIVMVKKDAVMGVYYDLKTNNTYLVYVFKKTNHENIDVEKLKNEIYKNPDVIDCNVVDEGDKIYIYEKLKGINLNLINNGIL